MVLYLMTLKLSANVICAFNFGILPYVSNKRFFDHMIQSFSKRLEVPTLLHKIGFLVYVKMMKSYFHDHFYVVSTE